MRLELNHHLLDLTCPHCAHRFEETIGKLKAGPTLSCPRCAKVFRVDADQLRTAAEDIEKRMVDLRKTLKIRIDL